MRFLDHDDQRKTNKNDKRKSLPMSICVQLILNNRPSSAVVFVSPIMACLEAVYAYVKGRGVCAETEPLLMMRPDEFL